MLHVFCMYKKYHPNVTLLAVFMWTEYTSIAPLNLQGETINVLNIITEFGA